MGDDGGAVMEGITVFGLNGSGGSNVGLTANGVPVLLTSRAEHDAACVDLAAEIRNAGDRLEIRAAQEKRHAAEVAVLREKIATLQAQRDAARATIEAATRGARRFFGQVLCKPHSKGEWSGAVWLLDPEKQEGSFGLLFGSLAEVRAAHPELWIVGLRDDGILLDARPLAALSHQAPGGES